LEHFLFSINIFWIILPIDFHVFQRGRYTTNQQSLYSQMFPNLKKMHTLSGKASKISVD
jgi:type II secretory pathway component PulL